MKCGLDDWFANGGTRLELDNLITDTLPGSVMDWPEPIPLDPTTGPPFPLEALPGTIGAYVSAVAHTFQVPADLPALVALGTLSAAVGGKYAVEPMEDWSEPVHVMVMPVLKSGERKSGVMREITRPVRDFETDRRVADREALALWKERRLQKQEKLNALRKQSVKLETNTAPTTGDSGAKDRLTKINTIASRIETLVKDLNTDRPPVVTQVIADNVTPESAQQILHAQGGSLAVISPESAFLTNIAGRYSKGNPDLDVYLKGHAADPIRSNRVTRDEDDIPRACLTMCISPQPSVVARMGAVEGWIDQGGAARLLPAFPVSNVGSRDVHPRPIPYELREEWADLIRRALRLKQKPTTRKDGKPGDPVPHTLGLDADAQPIFHVFRAWRESERRPGGLFASSGIDTWGDKFEGAVLRIAGLLHIAEHEVPQGAAISTACLESAITLGHYFHQQAVVMYAMSGRTAYGEASAIRDMLGKLGVPSISRRDFYINHAKSRAAYAKAADLVPVLGILEEYGWIRQVTKDANGPGAPSRIILLHPEISHQNHQNTPDFASESNSDDFDDYIRGIEETKSNPSNVSYMEPSEPNEPTGTDGRVEF